MTDAKYAYFNADVPRYAFNITPNNSADLEAVTRWITIDGGTTPEIRVTLVDMADGTFITINVNPSVQYRMAVKRLWSTGTTATGIVGWV